MFNNTRTLEPHSAKAFYKASGTFRETRDTVVIQIIAFILVMSGVITWNINTGYAKGYAFLVPLILFVAPMLLYILFAVCVGIYAKIYKDLHRPQFEQHLIEQLTYLPMNADDYKNSNINNIGDFELALAYLFHRMPGTYIKEDYQYLSTVNKLYNRFWFVSDWNTITPVANQIILEQLGKSYTNALQYFEDIDEDLDEDLVSLLLHPHLKKIQTILSDTATWDPTQEQVVDDVAIYNIKQEIAARQKKAENQVQK